MSSVGYVSPTGDPRKVSRAGDTMSGPLVLAGDPAADLQPATKQYADGKVPASRAVNAGTGLTGGGNLSADRTLSVQYGTTAGTAAQGNDPRLSNARTPTAHKASHAAGGSDVLSPADIGAVAKAGDTMTGLLNLSGAPTSGNHAATKSYVDGIDANNVNKSGDTMTGPLTAPDLNAVQANIPTNTVLTPQINALVQSPFASMWHDLFAFNRQLGVPLFEQAADGTTFSASSLETANLFSMKDSPTIIVADSTTNAARWTWGGSQVSWSMGAWLVISNTHEAVIPVKRVVVETSPDGGATWVVRHTSSGNWNQSAVWHHVGSYSGDNRLRLTITWTAGGPVRVSAIRLLTSRWGNQGGGRENEFPYVWDSNGRMAILAPIDPEAGLTVGDSIKLTSGTVYNLPLPVNGNEAANKTYVDTKAPARPNPAAGRYLFTASPQGAATNNTLANSMLRLIPWLVDEAMTIDRIGADIAAVGEAGCKLRLGIYADNGSAYPGPLIVDAGQVAGDSATVQEIILGTPITLQPGLYWVGGAVQNAATTQPTVRVVSNWTPPIQMAIGTTMPVANQAQIGYSQGSVAGALPASFTTSLSIVSSAPRLFVRTA